MEGALSISDFIAELSNRFANDAEGMTNLTKILALESEFPKMKAEEKCEGNRFHGCQSQIWLILTHDPETNKVTIQADSDSRIVRGLLAIAVGLYSERQPCEIGAHPPSLLRETGLVDALTPSRSNGFHRLLLHIYNQGKCIADAVERSPV